MKELFLRFAKWLQGSMDNDPGGASSKKLSALWAIVIMATPPEITWMVWAYQHNNWELLPEVEGIVLFFAGLALGINAIEKIRNKNNPTAPQ